MISFFKRKKKEVTQKPKRQLYKIVVDGKKMYVKDEAKVKKYKLLEKTTVGSTICITKVK